MKAFVKLAERWKIEKGAWPALLGRSSPNTVRHWIKTAETGGDREAYADAWVRTENWEFAGQTPLSRLQTGQFSDLDEIRLYVERALAPSDRSMRSNSPNCMVSAYEREGLKMTSSAENAGKCEYFATTLIAG